MKLAIGTGSAGGVPSGAPGRSSTAADDVRGAATLVSGRPLGRGIGRTGRDSDATFVPSVAAGLFAGPAFDTGGGAGFASTFFTTGLVVSFVVSFVAGFVTGRAAFATGFASALIADLAAGLAETVAAFGFAAPGLGLRAFAGLLGRFAVLRIFFAGLREFVALPI